MSKHHFTLSEIRATRQFLRFSVLRTIEWMNEQVELHATGPLPEPVVIDAERVKRSVVAPSYRDKYEANGDPRGCGDWLHRVLAARTLDEKGQLRVAAFEAILDLNGVQHAKWSRSTPGWQGRLRMSGRTVLAGILKRQGFIATPDGEVRP